MTLATKISNWTPRLISSDVKSTSKCRTLSSLGCDGMALRMHDREDLQIHFATVSIALIGMEPAHVNEFMSNMALSGFPHLSVLSLDRKCLQDPTTTQFHDIVFINIDVFDSLSLTVDVLLEYRLKTPRTRIVIVSQEVERDDFGEERKPICDVTLKWPVGPARLTQALNFCARTALETAL